MNVMEMGYIELADKKLTMEQKFHLLKIAHETKVLEIRNYALTILEEAMFNTRFVAPEDIKS